MAVIAKRSNAQELARDCGIISIKEARKILGKDFADLSDDQVVDMVNKLYAMAVATVREYSSIPQSS